MIAFCCILAMAVAVGIIGYFGAEVLRGGWDE